MTPVVSDRQRQILEFIVTYTEEYGYPPSSREIGKHVGLASTSSVDYQLRRLKAKGLIRRDPFRARTTIVKRETS